MVLGAKNKLFLFVLKRSLCFIPYIISSSNEGFAVCSVLQALSATTVVKDFSKLIITTVSQGRYCVKLENCTKCVHTCCPFLLHGDLPVHS